MASPTQLVQMAFAGGLDESQRDEVLDPSTAFAVLENARQDKRGGLNKRPGFTYQTLSRLDATSRSSGLRLFAHDKQTCVIDNSNTLDAYSTAASVNVNRGRVPEASLSAVPLPGISTSAPVDGALCGNYYVGVYRAGGTGGFANLYGFVLDINTGAVIRAAELLYTATTTGVVRLAVYGTRVVAFFGDTSGAVSSIGYRILNTATAATLTTGWSVSANAATDVADSTKLCACSLTDKVALTYVNDSAGTDQLTVLTLDSTGVLQTQTINTSTVTPDATSVHGDTGDTLWVAWNESTDVKVCGLDPADITATALASTAVVITTGSAVTDGQLLPIDVCASPDKWGEGRLFVNESTAIRVRTFTTAAGAVSASGSTVSIYNAFRTGRVFRYGSRYYALCGSWAGTTHAIVCDLTEDNTWIRPVAALTMGLDSGFAAAQAWVTGATAYVPYGTRTSAKAASGYTLYGLRLAKLDFVDPQRWNIAKHAGRTILGGGVLSSYDGSSVTEVGFLVRPRAPTAADAGSGSGPNGAYRYVVVYEAIDKTGTRHFSSVSDPSASLSVVDNTITVTVRPLSISSRISATTDPAVRISIYRTIAGGEPPYYYLTSIDNALTAATLTYSDSTTDATLQTREKLYAPSLPGVNGSAQDRRPPPGLTYVTSYNSMLVGAQGEDVWYSGQDVAGEGTWFNPIFQVPVSGDGNITGLASQDGTLFVFKRRSIFAIAGEPPSDNGASGGLGTPRRLAVDVGCINARSIVVTSLGIFFQSERGIELLTRAQSVNWIGAPVQDTLASYPACSAATLDPIESVVYFELATSENAQGTAYYSADGRTLVYDLSLGQWQSVDRRTSYAGTADTPAQSAAMIWDGSEYRYAWLEQGGYVRPEQDSHLDTGSADTWVTMKATTGWVKLSGIQGQQVINRVLLLAKKQTRADISIALAYDYDATFETATTWAANDVDTLSTALARVQLGHDAHDDGEGQAVRVRISDATPTGGTVSTGEGATWIALTFEGTPRPNAAQLPDTAR